MALARRSCALLVATTMLGLACGGGGSTPPGATPTQIAKAPSNDGDNQVGPAGQSLATPLAVIVRDASDNPVRGVSVTWAAGTGSGSVTSQSNTDANGIAISIWTLGANAGAQTATASKTGLTGSPVSFGATAQIQGATQMALNGGDAQVGPATQALPTSLSIIAQDQNGTPVQGVTISWSAANGGSVNPTQSSSGANGVASTKWTLGPNAGNQTATATKTGLSGSPVAFHAVAQIQGATRLEEAPANSGNDQTDTVLATLPNPYRVLATNQDGAPVPGVAVNWTVSAGGGGVSAPMSTTDVNGIAVITHTFGSTAGAQSVRAAVTGLIGSPVTFTSTALPGIPTQIAKNGGDGQTGVINSALPTPHSVIVHDSHGNVVPQVPVVWVAGDGGGSVNPTTTMTGSNGVASTTRTLGPTLGTQTDTAKTPGLSGSPVVFTATGALAVQVGGDVYNVFFRSVHNGSQNPAVDTIPAGAAIIWTWVGLLSHGVHSTGVPSFPNSAIMSGAGKTYTWTFTTAGTYAYDCAVHGTLMTGLVVVQ